MVALSSSLSTVYRTHAPHFIEPTPPTAKQLLTPLIIAASVSTAFFLPLLLVNAFGRSILGLKGADWLLVNLAGFGILYAAPVISLLALAIAIHQGRRTFLRGMTEHRGLYVLAVIAAQIVILFGSEEVALMSRGTPMLFAAMFFS